MINEVGNDNQIVVVSTNTHKDQSYNAEKNGQISQGSRKQLNTAIHDKQQNHLNITKTNTNNLNNYVDNAVTYEQNSLDQQPTDLEHSKFESSNVTPQINYNDTSNDDENEKTYKIPKDHDSNQTNIEETKLPSSTSIYTYLLAAKDSRNYPYSDKELQYFDSKRFKKVKFPSDYTRDLELVETIKKFCKPPSFLDTFEIPQKFRAFKFLPAAPELELCEFHIRSHDYHFFSDLFETVDENKVDPKLLRSRKLLLLLFKVKCGVGILRRSAKKLLINWSSELQNPNIVLTVMLRLIENSSDTNEERFDLYDILFYLCRVFQYKISSFTKSFYRVVFPSVLNPDRILSKKTSLLLSEFLKYVKFGVLFATIRSDLDNVDNRQRLIAIKVAVAYTKFNNTLDVKYLIKALLKTNDSINVCAGLQMVSHLALNIRQKFLTFIDEIIPLMIKAVQKSNLQVKLSFWTSVKHLAYSVKPYGFQSFRPIVQILAKQFKYHHGSGFIALVNAFVAVVNLMHQEDAEYFTKIILSDVTLYYTSNNKDVLQSVIEVTGTLAARVAKTDMSVFKLDFFIKQLINPIVAEDHKLSKLLLFAGKQLTKHLDPILTAELSISKISESNSLEQLLMISILLEWQRQKIFSDVNSTLLTRLIDAILISYHETICEDSDVCIDAVVEFLSIENELKVRNEEIIELIRWNLHHSNPTARRKGCLLFSKLVPLYKQLGYSVIISTFMLSLVESLQEEFPLVLASVLNALNSGFAVLQNTFSLSAVEIVPRLVPILNSKNTEVLFAAIELVDTLVNIDGISLNVKEIDRICYSLLDLLCHNDRKLRNAAIHAFGSLALSIGPQDVLLILLNNLRMNERQTRICTTVAIAVVGNVCGPYTILPSLLNEFKVHDSNVQHGVLKSLSFLFEYIGDDCIPYCESVYTLLAYALSDRDAVDRQIACWATKHLALGCIGAGKDDLFISLLNFVWPNIIEGTVHLNIAVLDAIDGLKVVLGPAYILYYLLSGLFHSSKRVKAIYWRIYNMIYSGHLEDLCPHYPEIDAESHKYLERSQLYLTL